MGGAERALAPQIEATPRRTTVLYARVDGEERLRAQALRLRTRCVAGLSQAAELSGGRVVRKQPDAVMALFASPDAATAAAARMQAYAEAGGHLAADTQVRIGYDSGPVTQYGARDVRGETVNRAREFSGYARHGQIVTSARTAAELSSKVRIVLRPLASRDATGEHSLREVAWRDAANQILGPHKDGSPGRPKAIRLAYRGKVLVRRREWDIVTMGRDPNLDFVIDEHAVSRHHCDVVRRGGRFILRDHSTNGTFVMVPGEGEVHVHVAEIALAKAGWISLGLSGDITEEVVRYTCE
jgi:class 3 adenylate cyclase